MNEPTTPQEPITKAELKRIFQPGLKLRLVNSLVGPCDKPRTVQKATSYGFVMITGEGRLSDLRFSPGDQVKRSGRTITIYSDKGVLEAQYVIEE